MGVYDNSHASYCYTQAVARAARAARQAEAAASREAREAARKAAAARRVPATVIMSDKQRR